MSKAAKTRKRIPDRDHARTEDRALFVWAIIEARRLRPEKGRQKPLSATAACKKLACERGLVVAASSGGIGDLPSPGDNRDTIIREFRKAVRGNPALEEREPVRLYKEETLRDYHKQGQQALKLMAKSRADAWRRRAKELAASQLRK